MHLKEIIITLAFIIIIVKNLQINLIISIKALPIFVLSIPLSFYVEKICCFCFDAPRPPSPYIFFFLLEKIIIYFIYQKNYRIKKTKTKITRFIPFLLPRETLGWHSIRFKKKFNKILPSL